MGFALVGVVGAFTSAATSSITPPFGQPTTSGNLLVATVTANVLAFMNGPGGWTQGEGSSSTSLVATTFFKANCLANESAPNFSMAGGVGTQMYAQLFEFTPGSLDPNIFINLNGSSSPLSFTFSTSGTTDQAGSLWVSSIGWHHSAPGTATLTTTFTGNTAVPTGTSGTASVADHANFAYGLSGAGLNTDAFSDSTTLGGIVSVATGISIFNPDPETNGPFWRGGFRRPGNVGPQVLRFQHRNWKGGNWERVPDPQTTYTPPIQISNPHVGPMVMRRRVHQPSYWSGGGPSLFIQAINGALSFAGLTPLTITTKKGMTGGLSFTGPTNLLKAIAKGISGGLSFTGKQLRVISKGLTAAILSFTGASRSGIRTLLTGGLSFTGPTNLIKTIVKKTTGGLSFTGNQARAIGKGLVAAGLSFTGAFTRLTSTNLVAASLSFAGSMLSSRLFQQALTAVLSFSGTQTRIAIKVLASVLSFTGASRNAISKIMSASLSFAGSAPLVLLIKGLVASLGFAGTIFKRTIKSIFGSLSFVGAWAFSGLVQQFLLALNASLGFAGSIGRGRFKTLIASMKATATSSRLRWYIGPFKFVSQGVLRAVSRALNNMLTKNRDLD